MSTRPPWYAPGLSFGCTQCGNCCSGNPGYVWATPEEVRRIAEATGRTDGWLPRDRVRREGFRYSLTEHADGDCVFLQRRPDGRTGCRIYAVRPAQCRTWPFWPENLVNKAAWTRAGLKCPGIGRERDAGGQFVPVERIGLLANAPSPQQPSDTWVA